MKSRLIAVTAVASVAVLTLADLFLRSSLDDRGRFWYYVVVRTGLFAVVALSAAVAANHFHWWSEHVGRGWGLFCIAYGVLVASEITKRFFPQRTLAQELLLGVANLALIGAYWLFARSFRIAGIRYYGSAFRRHGIMLVVTVLAVLLVWGSARMAIDSLGTAQPHPGQLVSALADLITFLLSALLLLIAISLRGGSLFWTFALLTIGTFGWMFNQGSAHVLHWLGRDGAIAAGRNFGFTMACCFIAAAALVQWAEASRGAVAEVRNA